MVDSGKPVRVRYAPSPTGFLHIGGLRTALYNYLFAKRYKGTFILRIEDTDQTRFVEGSVENLVRSLSLCGLTPDEGVMLDSQGAIIEKGSHGPYTQSKRLDVYQDHAHRLVSMSAAYYCVCSSERLEKMRAEAMAAKQPAMYDKHCRSLNLTREAVTGKQFVVRLAVPSDRTITFHDLIRGPVSFNTAQVDDQVLLKSDGFPTYHLAVVVDDHAMEISHVLRAEEWLPSTPKHILLYEAFGWAAPAFAHLPLLLNSDRSKLSKRQGDVAVEDYLKKGYLPEALVNFVAMMGWNPTADREIYQLQELIGFFDVSKVNMSGAVVNFEKLDWMNGMYIREKSLSELLELVMPYLVAAQLLVVRQELNGKEKTMKLFATEQKGAIKKELDREWLLRVIAIERDRLKRLDEIAPAVEFFFRTPQYDGAILAWKDMSMAIVGERLQFLVQLLQSAPEPEWESVRLEAYIKNAVTEAGLRLGEVLWPMRVALSGRAASPPPFDIASILGKHETLQRLSYAITRLGQPV